METCPFPWQRRSTTLYSPAGIFSILKFEFLFLRNGVTCSRSYGCFASFQHLSKLLKEKIYVIGFSFPVVPKNEARIRVQISASHTKNQLDLAINAFKKIGKELKLIN